MVQDIVNGTIGRQLVEDRHDFIFGIHLALHLK